MLFFGRSIRLCGALLVGLILVAEQGHAERTPDCTSALECLRVASRLWFDTYSSRLTAAEAEYRAALATYQRAERTGRPEIISAAKQLLDLKGEKVRSARSALRTVGSREFGSHLQSQLANVTRQHEEAHKRLERYQAAWDRIGTANEAQRQAVLRDLRQIEKAADRHAGDALLASVHTIFGGAAFSIATATLPASILSRLPPDVIERLPHLQAHVAALLEGAVPIYSIGRSEGHPNATYEQSIALAELVLGAGVVLAASPSAGVIAASALVGPPLAKETLAVAALYYDMQHRRAAEQRLRQIADERAYWQERIAIARLEVFHLTYRLRYARDLAEIQEQVAERVRRGD